MVVTSAKLTSEFSMNHPFKKKVVLYLITQAHLGGAQKHLADLMKYSSDKYEIHLAIAYYGYLSDVANSLNIKVHIIPSLKRNINPINDLKSLIEFISLVRQIKPDLIHAHSSKPGVIARLAGKISKTPVLFTAHGWGFDENAPFVRRMIVLLFEKFMAPLTTNTICVCQSDYDAAVKLNIFKPDQATVIYNCAEDINLPPAKPAQDPPRLIMVARFNNHQKDQLSLIDAISQLEHNIHLDFVGTGPDFEQVKAYAASIGVDHQISFLGDRNDVPKLLSESQIFVLATHYEGFPISILEAMRAGLPIVATDVNGIYEQVEDGINGFLVPHQDSPALVTALSKLIESANLRQQLGEMSRKKFLNEFNIERMMTDVHHLYDRTLGNPPEQLEAIDLSVDSQPTHERV
jgi:glycosyltransferase involved in cell wall biosynthesis